MRVMALLAMIHRQSTVVAIVRQFLFLSFFLSFFFTIGPYQSVIDHSGFIVILQIFTHFNHDVDHSAKAAGRETQARLRLLTRGRAGGVSILAQHVRASSTTFPASPSGHPWHFTDDVAVRAKTQEANQGVVASVGNDAIFLLFFC